MSISIVYTSAAPVEATGGGNLEGMFGDAPTLASMYGYIKEFHITHPTIKLWSDDTAVFDNTTHVDLEFPDQTTLDMYLIDSRNLQTVATSLIENPELIEFTQLNPTTSQTIQILENSNKDGLTNLNISELIILE